MHCARAAVVLALIGCVVAVTESRTISEQLNGFQGNLLTAVKTLRKPFASPLLDGLKTIYQRSKRQAPAPKGILDFQQMLNELKETCARELGLAPDLVQKPLLYEDNPTAQQKCLISCILKRSKLVDDNNRLSLPNISRIAADMSENNPLVVSIAVATANNCNQLIKSTDACESAAQISKCIANEMKAYKMRLHY